MIKKFLKRMTILKKFIDDIGFHQNYKYKQRSVRYQKVIATRDSALYQQASECLEVAFQIYSSFIMKGAPYQLNLDHNLREKISLVILSPHSPIKEYFDTNENIVDDKEKDEIKISGRLNKPSVDDLKVQRNNIEYRNKISEILLILKQLYPLFEEVGVIMYRLMETDSLSKFYNSKEFEDLK